AVAAFAAGSDGLEDGHPHEGSDVRRHGDGGNGATDLGGGGCLRGADRSAAGCPWPGPGGGGASGLSPCVRGQFSCRRTIRRESEAPMIREPRLTARTGFG